MTLHLSALKSFQNLVKLVNFLIVLLAIKMGNSLKGGTIQRL